MYARCGNGSVVTHFGIEVELVDGTWLSYQKA
jgi:hypothetical protein